MLNAQVFDPIVDTKVAPFMMQDRVFLFVY